MKVGVIGGTFDPVHNGHIAIAGAVMARLSLAKVIFVPAAEPRLRASDPCATAEQRREMVRRALADYPRFRLSDVDIKRGGQTRTVDTLADLRAELGEGPELYFILGQDSLPELPRWWQPRRLIKLCRLVAVPRPGYPTPDLASLEAAIPGITPRVILPDEPVMDIGATDIRQRVARGEAIDHLVPSPVAEYIEKHGLYRGGQGTWGDSGGCR